MLNTITIMGRLVRDPELRYTTSGTAVASFTLAVERDFGNKDGGNKPVDFIDCVAWRHTAEFAANYFSKGRMAVASGRLQVRPWEDKNGNKRKAVEVVAQNIYFGDSKRDSDGGGYQSPDGYGSQGQARQPQQDIDSGFVDDYGEDDDLPF